MCCIMDTFYIPHKDAWVILKENNLIGLKGRTLLRTGCNMFIAKSQKEAAYIMSQLPRPTIFSIISRYFQFFFFLTFWRCIRFIMIHPKVNRSVFFVLPVVGFQIRWLPWSCHSAGSARPVPTTWLMPGEPSGDSCHWWFLNIWLVLGGLKHFFCMFPILDSSIDSCFKNFCLQYVLWF